MTAAAAGSALAGRLTSATVPELLARLAPQLKSGAALALDLSGVEYADSAGVSLLLELRRRAQAAGATLSYAGAPEQLRKLTRYFGVDALLGLGH